MLEKHDISFIYREYKKDPLSTDEIKMVIQQLGIPANELLRKREKAYKELELKGTESNDVLIPLFVQFPSLMQRPIFVHNNRAVLCRPFDKILELL